jgi:hypothetical protein
MFQIWACKQVMDLAPANGNKPWDKTNLKFPSCDREKETTSHMLFCEEVGRVDVFKKSINLLDQWMQDIGTDPTLQKCIMEYCEGRGGKSMDFVTMGRHQQYQQMAAEQDKIRWRRFMESMVCIDMRNIQATFYSVQGSSLSPDKWATGLIIKLLETTHAQWLFRCIQTHNKAAGVQRTLRKEELQRKIERHLEEGTEDLLEEDQYLAEVNMEDLETSSGERHEYWLVAWRAAKKASRL